MSSSGNGEYTVCLIVMVHALRRGPFLTFYCLPREVDEERGGVCLRLTALIDEDAVKRPAVHVQGHIVNRERVGVSAHD